MGSELEVQSTALDRLPDTVAAYQVVLQSVAPADQIQAFEQVPRLLGDDEPIVALAHASVKKKGPVLVVLTDRRLLFADARRPNEHFAIDRAAWTVQSAGTNFLWGNNAKLRAREGGHDELVLRSFLPSSEALRILGTLGLELRDTRLRALPGGFPEDPGAPPIAGLWELSVYHDRIVDHEGNHLPFNGDVEAVADAAGNIAVTRGRNLAAKGVGTLALGPIGLFFMGNAKERQTDTRELYLLVEGPNWAYTHAFQPELGEALRGFAQQINVAARQHRQHHEPGPSSSESPAASTSIASELRELASLRDEGLLTPEEFEAEKVKLLER